MQADEASNAHVGAQSLSYHSQNTAIITEFTTEIKSHATSPPLPVANYLTGDSPVHLARGVSTIRSQAIAGPDALPQGAFLLDADQRLETLPVRI
jgi:hypothetical protein